MNWSQFKTILWLRWRLSQNQWSRGGTLNAVLSMIGIVLVLIIAVFGAIIGLLVGIFALDTTTKPLHMLVTWDIIIGAFLFVWLIGLVSEIQRSETINIGKLLHLPVSLKNIFFINYLASHLTFSIIIFVPVVLGISLGLIISHGLIMILFMPLIIGFIFMITSWTYCLRGWLITLMVNQRRRRTVIAVVTFSFIILFQLPNMFSQFFINRNMPRHRTTGDVQNNQQINQERIRSLQNVSEGLLLAHKVVPFLWVGNGAKSLAEGSPWAALLGTAGVFGIGGLGLRRAYRTTIRFYQGAITDKKVKKKAKEEKVVSAGMNRLEKSLPFVSDETSALAMAYFQNFLRATEIKMALATNFIMLLFFGSMILLRHSDNINENIKPFIAIGAITVSFFGLSHLVFNQFGYDRNGFRALVLSPVSRKYILQGKNLAFLPVSMGIGGTLILVITIFLRLPIFNFIAAILQLITAFLIMSMLGNLVSILVPYRIAPGSMKPTKMPTLIILIMMVVSISFPIAMTPIFIPPTIGFLLSKFTPISSGLINLFFSIIVILVIAFFYRLSLEPLGNLLQKREKKILEIVTKEIE